MTPVVQAVGIDKEYVRSSVRRGLHGTLRDSLASWGRRVLDRSQRPRVERFLALKDVSLELYDGEVLGVVGPNGSGKSTLLKIISQITTPTRGEVRIAGTVGSLLEVGTGFHPELTGRENVYLNGAIIGMSRAEISRKFDEIVAFSGVEAFIDMPVKRFSSGMQVRLAFAIAAHIEPDILILDEVLAVGDVGFQRKCMEKLKEIGKTRGRAVILVSHSMVAVRAMCSKALLLDGGRVRAYGAVDDIIARYQRGAGPSRASAGAIDLKDWGNRIGGDVGARITWAELHSGSDGLSEPLHIGDSLRLTFGCSLDPTRAGRPITLSVVVSTADGMPIANMVDMDSKFSIESAKPEEVISVTLRDVRLYPGCYTLSLWIGTSNGETWDYARDCLTFDINPGGLSRRPLSNQSGLIFLTPEWNRS
jgi:lipopolysaccharide transport system ATP-binding protein